MIFNLFWTVSLSPPEANGPIKIQVMFRTWFPTVRNRAPKPYLKLIDYVYSDMI
jgi:hypothetical protein